MSPFVTVSDPFNGTRRTAMRYLTFDLSDNDDGVSTIEALASTSAGHHPAVMAEVQAVLDWAWRHFSHTHGPADDGMDWDHDLQVQIEGDGWHAVTLTLSASPRFVAAFREAFGEAFDGDAE